MAVPLATRFATSEEYLAFERQSAIKHEYVDGKIVERPSANRQHNLIASNILASFYIRLGPRYEVYPSSMRVKVGESGLYTYPDVVVAGEEPQFEDAEMDTLLNPTVLIEILSASTERYDRGDKFEQYRKLNSVFDYLLIAQDQVQVEHYIRQPDSFWLFTKYNSPDDVVRIESIQCELNVGQIYEKVERLWKKK